MELFSQPIVLLDKSETTVDRATLTEQVFNILRSEILDGRWEVGERLPGIAEIAKRAGISRAPVEAAFQLLKDAGYVEQKERYGTFLLSTHPRNAPPSGVIGVVLKIDHGHSPAPSFGPTESNNIHLLNLIMNEAAQRNMLIKTHYILDTAESETLNLRSGPFLNQVDGVISLYPFPRKDLDLDLKDRIPMVFLGTERPQSVPSVAGDSWCAGYLLTKRVIGLGHREIALFSNPEPVSYGQGLYQEGHARAMREAGLSLHEESIRQSRSIPWGDLGAYQGFLREWKKRVTAIIAGSFDAASILLDVALLNKMRVPEEISLAGLGSFAKSGYHLTGCRFDSTSAVGFAFDMLEEIKRAGRTVVHRRLCAPILVDGNTAAPPAAIRSAARALARAST